MRRVAFYLLLVVLALASTYSAAKDETVDELKSRFESAHPEDRAELGIRIAKQQLRNADKFYNDGNVDQAVRRLEDVRTSLLNAMFANDKKNDKKRENK